MTNILNYAGMLWRSVTGKKQKLPTYLILFVTAKCNSKCVHCFYWKDLNAHQDELSLEEIERLSLSLGKLTHLGITGGEPTLREDVARICELFYERNKVDNIHIPTNCVDPERIKKIISGVLDKCRCSVTVAMSLDGLKEDHDTARGVKGNFNSVLRTYALLSKLKITHPNLKLVVNTVISNRNCGKVKEIVNFVKENMPLLDDHGFDWVRGEPKDKETGLPPLEEIKDLTPFLMETRRYYAGRKTGLTSRLELAVRHYLSDFKYETIRLKRQLAPCRAGEIFAVVYPQGDVAFCELLPPIGNLRKNSLAEIWNSEKAESQREHIRLKKCYCTHGCFQPTNVILSLSSYPGILKHFIKG